ncbi:unnamed protein product [Schistosoma spindalis]|nr:unnamed protein product [Schistosoma spindale]
MLTFLGNYNRFIIIDYIMYYVIIIIQLLIVINSYSVLSYQNNELIRNTIPTNRLKRIVDYSHSKLDHSIVSNTMNIFYRIRADRKGLITCEINIKEIDFSHSNKNIINQTQFINKSIIEMKPTSTVYLICPQLSTSICYMDCSPNCLLNENGCTIPRSIAQVIEGCQFKRINASTFQYQYIINMEELDHTGLWNCEYRGQRAVRSLELQAAETFPTNINNASNNSDKNITSINNDIQIKNGSLKKNRTDIINQSHRNIKSQSKLNKINSTITKSEMTENWKNPNNLDKATMETMHQKDNLMNLTDELKNDTLDKKYIRLAQKQESQRLLDFKLTRPELVLSLIGILAISLIVNIILIIRCLLLKSYLDDTQHGKVNTYLKCILCIQTKSNINMSTSINKSLNSSNHQPLLMTSCHVGQIIEPNTTFMNYSTQIDDSLTESILLYHNKSGHYTHNENNHLLPVNSSIMLPNLIQTTTSILPLSTTYSTNVSYVSTTPIFHHLMSNSSTINPDNLLKYHKQNGQSSSGISLESDPTSIKRTNLYHSQSVNYSKQSNHPPYPSHSHHPLLSECCFQNGSITIPGQNGSLNGSLLYSNDSISLTDTTNGNGVIIPNHIIVSQNPYSTYHMQYLYTGEQSDQLTRKFDIQKQFKQHQQYIQFNDNTNNIYQQSTELKDHQSCTNNELSNLNDIEINETCHLIKEKQINHDLSNYTFKTSSTIDSLSHNTNQSINQLSSCLTPLVVRFPSGESGFLFCPTHTTINEHYLTDSLSRQSNCLSIISNHNNKSINIDSKENDKLLKSDIKINKNCSQNNLENNLILENSIESNQISDKLHYSLSKTTHHLITMEMDSNYDNYEKSNTLKNSNISLINYEKSLIKSNEKLDIINIQTSLHNNNNNNIHQNGDLSFNDGSNDRLRNQNDIQELNINPTIYPVH